MKPAILLVDDNDEILEFLSSDLSEKYEITVAYNGKQALDILETTHIQLVISDVMMPVMDGFELCKLIKSNVESSHIPVILLTAKNTLQSKIEGLGLGADVYVDKPFSPEYLQAQIASLLTNRNNVKDYFIKSPLAHIKSMAYSKTDEQFLEELNEIILKHMDDPSLDVELIARYMNMSRPTLYRKIKAISDLTPNELINIARLKKAATLLSEGKHRITEIVEQVGYTSLTHFGRNFQKQFGLTPSDYLKDTKNR